MELSNTNSQMPQITFDLPTVKSNEISVFTELEIRRIRYNADTSNSTELGILLALFTGLRIGELCALTWADIDINE